MVQHEILSNLPNPICRDIPISKQRILCVWITQVRATWRKEGCMPWWLKVITTNRSKYTDPEGCWQGHTWTKHKYRTICVFESFVYEDKIAHTFVCVHIEMTPKIHSKVCHSYPWGVGLEDKTKGFILSVTPGVCVCMHTCLCIHTHICADTYVHIHTYKHNIT